MKFETSSAIQLRQEQETKEMTDQMSKIHEVQEKCLPVVIENLKEILVELRKLNDLTLKSSTEGMGPTAEMIILNSSNAFFLLEEDLRKDYMKYAKDLINVSSSKQRLASAIELTDKLRAAQNGVGDGEVN